ncbi:MULTISPECIES: DUF3168 domain-containing protein [unclassified Brevundimonas]|uniref:DUF3168 domain-containing protein n=1 Tax=unclassified Brevundimonas TaxID=2622653 RepID=UPI0025BA429B|nr:MULTISPECIES: DUF3168 domain-containing protein [unclassified Brevundimonas]
MSDPQLPLQAAMLAAAKTSAAVTALLGSGSAIRFYDRTPDKPDYPMATFGPMQTIPDYDGCGTVYEIAAQVDCWSMAVGFPEVKRLTAAMVAALDQKLSVTGWTVDRHRCTVRTQREADGLTSRSIISLRYWLRPAA